MRLGLVLGSAANAALSSYQQAETIKRQRDLDRRRQQALAEADSYKVGQVMGPAEGANTYHPDETAGMQGVPNMAGVTSLAEANQRLADIRQGGGIQTTSTPTPMDAAGYAPAGLPAAGDPSGLTPGIMNTAGFRPASSSFANRVASTGDPMGTPPPPAPVAAPPPPPGPTSADAAASGLPHAAVRTPTVDEAAATVARLWPGTRITGRGRTAAENARIGGARNSYHIDDQGHPAQAIDFVPPPGIHLTQSGMRAALNADGQPVTEGLYEGPMAEHSTAPHFHWAFGPGHASRPTPRVTVPSPTTPGTVTTAPDPSAPPPTVVETLPLHDNNAVANPEAHATRPPPQWSAYQDELGNTRITDSPRRMTQDDILQRQAYAYMRSGVPEMVTQGAAMLNDATQRRLANIQADSAQIRLQSEQADQQLRQVLQNAGGDPERTIRGILALHSTAVHDGLVADHIDRLSNGGFRVYMRDTSTGVVDPNYHEYHDVPDLIAEAHGFTSSEGLSSYLTDVEHRREFAANQMIAQGQLNNQTAQVGIERQRAGYEGRTQDRADRMLQPQIDALQANTNQSNASAGLAGAQMGSVQAQAEGQRLQNSMLTNQQQLLQERPTASPTRRAQIDGDLSAIRGNLGWHISQDPTTGQFMEYNENTRETRRIVSTPHYNGPIDANVDPAIFTDTTHHPLVANGTVAYTPNPQTGALMWRIPGVAGFFPTAESAETAYTQLHLEAAPTGLFDMRPVPTSQRPHRVGLPITQPWGSGTSSGPTVGIPIR